MRLNGFGDNDGMSPRNWQLQRRRNAILIEHLQRRDTHLAEAVAWTLPV
jgi:hypothetical protein